MGSKFGPVFGQKMDEEQLSLWILRRLGAPLLKVELTECHLHDVISMAMHWYAAKKGFIRQVQLLVVPSITQYSLDTLADDIDLVTDVVFPLSAYDLTPLSSPWGWAWPDEALGTPMNSVYGGFAAGGAQSGGVVSSVVQVLQYSDMARRVFNGEFEWRQESRTLYVLPYQQPPTSLSAIVFYTSTKFTLVEFNERDHDIVKRYALAKAKLDLGRIRSKYDSYQGAAGAVNLDGQALLSEGQQEIEALDEELASSAMPVGFLVG